MGTLKLESSILQLVCRTCLKMNGPQINIFEHSQHDRLLFDLIMDCTAIKIQKKDGFPTKICTDCMEKLNSACAFKAMVIASNLKLQNFYEPRKIDKPLISNSDSNGIKQESWLTSEQSEVYHQAIIEMQNSQLVKTNVQEMQASSRRCDEYKVYKIKALSDKNENTNPKDQPVIKEEIFPEKSEISCSNEFPGFSEDSESSKSCSEDSSTKEELGNVDTKSDDITETAAAVKHKRKKGNTNNYDEKEAELLDNPDYQRIMKSGLSKKEKDRETVFCGECNKTFSFRYYVAIHAYTHTGNVPFKCDKCDKCYPKESLLKRHLRSHSQTRDFPCDECGKAFFKKQQLQYHKALKHSEERPHKCNVCEKAFKLPSLLLKHSLIHVNDKKYVCEICGRGFVEMMGLTKHKVTHTTAKKIDCPTCGKSFKCKSTLAWHLKKHLDTKPYICSYCGKRFQSTTILKNHILIHTGAKPFACDICGKTFRQRSCIGRHMRIHTGETPYPCKLCPSSFKYSHHLLNHMKIHQKDTSQVQIDLKTVGDHCVS